MFESSRDILNWALIVAVIVLTFFTAWILTCVVRMFMQMQRIVQEVSASIKKLTDLVDLTKSKISHAATTIPLVIKGIEHVIQLVSVHREGRSDRESKKKQK